MGRIALIFALFALSHPRAARADEPPESTDGRKTVRIVWFGQSGGISSHRGRNHAHLALYDRVGQGLDAFTPVDEGPHVFALGSTFLFREDGLKVADFRDFLAAEPYTFEIVSGKVDLLESHFELMLELPADEKTPVLDLYTGESPLVPGFKRTGARLVRWRNAKGATLMSLQRFEDRPRPLSADPTDYEIRFAFDGQVTPTGAAPRRLLSIGRPYHEGGRRVAEIQRMKAFATPPLILAAGNDIEEFSFVNAGAPDLQRPNTWEAYRRLGLTALVAGPAETAFGLDALQREAQQNDVSLLAANVADAPFAPWKLVASDGVQILVVGVLDPDMRPSSRLRGYGKRQISAPAVAVDQAVSRATTKLGRRPDLVVAIGHLSADRAEELIKDTAQIDLLLTDFEGRGTYAESVRSAVDSGRSRARHPINVVSPGSSRLGLVDLVFRPTASGGYEVTDAASFAVPIYAEQPDTPDLQKAIQKVRQPVYADAQETLLPDLGPVIDGDPALQALFRADPAVKGMVRAGGEVSARVTAALWRRLVVRLLEDRFSAEITLIPALTFPWSLAGPIDRLAAVANLNLPDEIRIKVLTAKQIKALVKSGLLDDLTHLGIQKTLKGPKVRGRLVDDRERYRVLFTDSIAGDPRVTALLNHDLQTRFVRDGVHYRADDDGRAVTVREAALTAFGEVAAQGPAAFVPWLAAPPTGPAPRWVFELSQMSVESKSYTASDDDEAYEQVRETRVNTATNSAVALRGTLGVSREGADINWVNRARFGFEKAFFADEGEGASEQETADELIFSTELQAPVWRLPGMGGMPFSKVSYATEFTPTEADDGAQNPRKQQLDGTLGLLWKGPKLKTARVGGLVTHDFASPVPDPQVGLLAAMAFRHPLEVGIWTVNGEARYYLPGLGEDDPSELGLVVKARTGLDVPVIAQLALGVYVDVFAYRGQHDTTQKFGASVVGGVALKYDRKVKP